MILTLALVALVPTPQASDRAATPAKRELPAAQTSTRSCRVDNRPDAEARCAYLGKVAREMAAERVDVSSPGTPPGPLN